MKKYKCTECKHSFTRNFDYMGKCPYCGRESIKEEIEQSEIVKEIENFWVKKIR